MKFKLDENLPQDLGAVLRRDRHDVRSVLEEGLGGATAASIAGICRNERRVLVTLDLDFANIRAYLPEDYFGIIVLRISRQDRHSVLAILRRALLLLRTEPVNGRLWIMDERRTRIRGGMPDRP